MVLLIYKPLTLGGLILKLLTLTIAAYNVEDYLEDTLSSLYKSKFLDEFEVLIVDDGSKDKTSEIGKKYENLAPQTFKYISKENGGHGSTINKGIELATGKYFKVIDGDDWVDTEAFDQFIMKLRNTDTDLVLTQHVEIYPNKKELINMMHNIEVNKIYSLNSKLNLEASLHTISVKSELLRKYNAHITEKVLYDDAEYVIWALYVSEDFIYFNLPVYMYRKGNENQSVSKKSMIKNIKMQEKVAYRLVELDKDFIKNISDNKQQIILKTIIQSVGGAMRTYLLFERYNNSKKQFINFDSHIKDISPDVYNQLNSNKFISLIRKGNYALFPLIRLIYRIRTKIKFNY